MHVLIIILSILVNLIICRDFYVGMFKRNDFLVAQDRLYKERLPHTRVFAKYGRLFKCAITFIRVVDRLGVGGGPKVEIIRGGLRKPYLVLRLMSVYNYPISANIYVGCENKMARIQTVAMTTAIKKETEVAIISSDKTSSVTTDTVTDTSKSDAININKTVNDNSTMNSTTALDNSTSGNKTR